MGIPAQEGRVILCKSDCSTKNAKIPRKLMKSNCFLSRRLKRRKSAPAQYQPPPSSPLPPDPPLQGGTVGNAPRSELSPGVIPPTGQFAGFENRTGVAISHRNLFGTTQVGGDTDSTLAVAASPVTTAGGEEKGKTYC